MKLAGYGRVKPDSGEIPLVTQKHACQRYCETNEHAFIDWYTDECMGDEPFLERDGFTEIMRYASNNELDGVVVYEWKRLSPTVGMVAQLGPLTTMSFDEPLLIHTSNGELDFASSEDPEEVAVGQSMATLTDNISVWRKKMKRFKIHDSLQDYIDRGETEKIGAPPYGLETDKQRYKNRNRVTEYLPDDQGHEDKFKNAIQILNTFVHEDTTPFEKEKEPTAHMVGKKYGIAQQTVKTIWQHQETFKEVAEKYRDELTILY